MAVNRWCRPVEKCSLSFSTGQRWPNKKNVFLNSEEIKYFLLFKILSFRKIHFLNLKIHLFYLVNIDLRLSTSTTLLFSWSKLTRLLISSWLTVDACWRPYYSLFHHAHKKQLLHYQNAGPFQGKIIIWISEQSGQLNHLIDCWSKLHWIMSWRFVFFY